MSAPSCALRRVYPPEPEWTTFHSSHRIIWATDTDVITSNGNSAGESGAQIPKPKGDVGCISKGGYSLRKVLGWDEDFYREVQDYIHKQVTIHLPESLPISRQKKVSLVYDAVAREYEIMKRYENNWVTKDFVTVYLRNRKRRGTD